MISNNKSTCPCCGGNLKFYDKVKRIVRTKGRVSKWIEIRRLKCINCGTIHRELPENILPYKQYEAELIIGVLDGLITCETLGYEDYPCESTMLKWLSQKQQLLLWINHKDGKVFLSKV